MAEILRMLAQAGGGFGPGGYSPNPYQSRNPNQLNQLANQFSRNLQTMRQNVPQWTPQPNPVVRTQSTQPSWMTEPTSQFLATTPQTTMQQPPTQPSSPGVDFNQRFTGQPQPTQTFPGGRVPQPRPDPIDAYVSRPARQSGDVTQQMIDPRLPPDEQ